MKTKFKDLLLYTLACVGAVSLLLSAIDKPKEDSQSVGKYHAVGTSDYVIIYNTQTGDHMKAYTSNYASGF
tara:strand:- start:152 stop:364 length:213 start_codon:yes stop_codon:yes gene_type:complete